MNSRPISTEYIQAANAVLLSKAHQISQDVKHCDLDWDWAIGKDMIEKFIDFLMKEYKNLGGGPYFFGLKQKKELNTIQKLNTRKIIELSENNVIIWLDSELNIFQTEQLIEIDKISPEELLSKKSRSECGLIAYYDNGENVRFYAGGITSKHIFLPDISVVPPRGTLNRWNCANYKQSVMDHYDRGVKRWNYTHHWHDRDKRILRKSTEDIFVESLYTWLVDHIYNATITRQSRFENSDAIDIYIQGGLNQSYLIEVKWTGRNESGTTHDYSKIEDSFEQIRTYLDSNIHIKNSVLLVYDGRTGAEFNQLVCEDMPRAGCKIIHKMKEKTLHPRAECMVLFLESQTASQKK